MTTRVWFKRLSKAAVVGVVLVTISACAGYDRKSNNTLIGAGLGGAAGAVLTEGDPLFTLGGAAAGGLLGNILTPDSRSYQRPRAQNRHRGATRRRHSAAPRQSYTRGHRKGPPRHSYTRGDRKGSPHHSRRH